MSWTQDTRRQVRGALIQPSILLLAVIGLTALVIGVLVPRVTEIYSRKGMELPGVTQALVAFSDAARSHGHWWLAGAAALLIAARLAASTTGGRYRIHLLRRKLPVIGRILSLFAASRFVNLFSLLHEAGVPVVRNLEIVQDATGCAVLSRGVRTLRGRVLDGGTLSDGLEDAGVFPRLVVRMLRIGEQTGEIGEAMDRVSDYYDREIPRALRLVTTLLQPALLMVSAAIVCFVVFAAFMPIVRMVTGGR